MVKAITKAPKDDLIFAPLGGSGEIGMNMSLYGYRGRWLIVDMGITFADETIPGVDIIVPDPAFLISQKDNIVGLVLTHAHEDHLGAVAWIWENLRCDIWATPFALSVLDAKFRDHQINGADKMHVLNGDKTVAMGPFQVSSLSINHSIPQPQSIIIGTDHGTVVHSGDWTFDSAPLVDKAYEEDRLKSIGEKGVLALICDSTNVFVEKPSESEAELVKSLDTLIGGIKTGRIISTSFASNVARMVMFARAADKNGRRPVLIGRSMLRFSAAARDNGYLKNVPDFLSDREGKSLPREKALYICTGSQGESRSALTRIAEGSHPSLQVDAGDTVIFSSSVIPGNEKAITKVRNLLISKGVRVVTEEDEFVHISGHPGRPELKRMYQLLKPKISVPAHGEVRHLREHASFARSCGVDHAIEVVNGQVLRLSGKEPKICGTVPTNTLALVGKRLVNADDPIFEDRKRMLSDGLLNVVFAVDSQGALCCDPLVLDFGLFSEGEDNLLDEIAEKAEAEFNTLSRRVIQRKKGGDDKIRAGLTSFLRRTIGSKPLIWVEIIHV